MNHQVTFTSSPSATAPGQWIGQVIDEASKQVLTRTSMTYPTRDEAKFGARVKWLGRDTRMALAAGKVGGAA